MTKEELQLKWDELLIQARFFCPDTSLHLLSVNFKRLYGVYPNEIGLLRAQHPVKNNYYVPQTVLRFMCAHLPKIADYCWKHTAEDWLKVVAAVNRSNHDTRETMCDVLIKQKDRKDLVRTQQIAARSRKVAHESSEKYQASKAGNQWAVCK